MDRKNFKAYYCSVYFTVENLFLTIWSEIKKKKLVNLMKNIIRAAFYIFKLSIRLMSTRLKKKSLFV